MKYIDPNTGREYTEEELLELAGDMPLQDYIAEKGYTQLIEEVEPVVAEQPDFQTATASEGADVVADIPEAPENTALDLENISLESATESYLAATEDPAYQMLKQAEKELKDFNEGIDYNWGPSKKDLAQRKKLENEVEAQRRKLAGSKIDFDVPETWVSKSQSDVIKALRREFPGIVFEETGAQILGNFGNAITANLGGEEIELDLVDWGNASEKEKKELVENFKKIESWDQVTKANDIALQGAFSGIMDPIKDGIIPADEFNKAIKDSGYQLVKAQGAAFAYDLIKDGKIVASTYEDAGYAPRGVKTIVDGDGIENYIRENFTKEEALKAKSVLYPYLKTFAEEKQVKVDKNIAALNKKFEDNPEEFYKQDIWDTQLQNYLENLATQGAIQKEEIPVILEQIKNNINVNSSLDKIAKGLVGPEGETGFNSYTEYLMSWHGNNETSLGISQQADAEKYAVQILRDAINLELDFEDPYNPAASFNDTQKALLNAALDQHLLYNLEDRIARENETIAEQILYDKPAKERELIRLSLMMEQVEPDAIRDELKKDGELIKNYNNTITDITLGEFERVHNNIKSIPGLGLEYNIDLGEQKDFFGESILPTFRITRLPDPEEITEEDYKKLLQAESDLYKLNLTLNNLREDYITSVGNYVNNLTELEVSVGERSIVKETKDGKKQVIDVLGLWDDINKEYDLPDLLADDFGNASSRIILSVPTLFGSEGAMLKEQSIAGKELNMMSMGTYDDPTGGGWTWGLRTFSTQSPNILLAIGTGATGNALTKSSGIVKTAIGTTFGITSGTDSYRRLTIQRDLLEDAKKQKEMLQNAWNEGMVNTFEYTQGMLDAEKAIAMYDMSNDQIFGASLSTGIIEGTVTRYIGTSNNTMKFLGDIKGLGPINVVDAMFKSGWRQTGMYGLEWTKRVGLEVLEEEIIYAGTQGISESLILERDADWSQFDDTAMVTLVTAGVSNGTGVGISGIKNYYAGKKFMTEVNEASQGIVEAMEALSADPARQGELTALIQEELKRMSLANSSLGADILASGAENVAKLVGLEIEKRRQLEEAGVTPDMNEQQKADQIKKYKEENLTTEEAKRFDERANSIESQINSIKEGEKNYDKAEELLGGAGREAKNRLNEADESWNANMSKREEVGRLIEEIHRMTTEMYINKAKQDPNNEKEWNRLQEENKKLNFGREGFPYHGPLTEKGIKDKWLEQRGKHDMIMSAGIVTLMTDVETNLRRLMGQDITRNLEVIVIPEIEDQQAYLAKLATQGLIDEKSIPEMMKGIAQNGNGFIVGNKYIVTTEEQRQDAIDNRNYRKGVVLYHEFGHAVDDSYFRNEEERNVYAINLYKGLAKSYPEVHIKAKEIVDLAHPEDAGKAWEDTSQKYKDEYVREAQTVAYIFAQKDKSYKAIEDSYKEGLYSKIKNRIFDQAINTEKRALSYMFGNNAAFRGGEMTAKVGKRLGQKGIGSEKYNKDTGIKNSKEIADNLNKKYKDLKNYKPITGKEVETMVSKVASRAFSRFGLGVPFNIRQAYYDKARFISHAKSKLQEIATQWNPTLGAFDSFMANRGMQRANKFVSELGVPDSRIKTERADEAKLDTRTSKVTTEGELKERAKREAKEETPPLTDRLIGKRKKEALEKVGQRLLKEIGYKLPVYNVDKTVKQKTNFISQLSKNLQLGFKDMIDFMGARNKTVDEYDQWLTDNYTTLLGPNGLTTTYLAKAFPEAVEKYVNGMGWVRYADWKGRTKGSKPGQIDFYKSTDEGPLAGSTAGNQKIRRVKDIKNTIPLAKFKSKYIKLSTNAKGEQVLKIPQMPTEGLAKQLVQEMGLDIFRKEISKETSEIKDKFLERQKLFGADVLDNYVEQLIYDVERPGIKNSLALISQDEKKITAWFEKRFDFYKELQNLMQSDDYILASASKQKTMLKNAHKAVYGDIFTKDEHEGVATQFDRLLVNLKKDPFVFRRLTNELSYDEYMDLIVTSASKADDLQSIRNYTGSTKAVGDLLGDKVVMQAARDFIVTNFYKKLKNKYGHRDALDMMVAFGASTFSNGSYKFGAFKVDENGALVEHGTSSNRAAILGNQDDILRIIQKIDPNVVSIQDKVIIFKEPVTWTDTVIEEGEVKKKKITGTSRKVNINTSADVKASHLKDNVNYANEKFTANMAWNFTVTLLESLKSEDANMQALILGVANGSANSSLRLAAPVWGRSTVLPNGTNLRIDVKDEKGNQVYKTEIKEVIDKDGNVKEVKVFKRDKKGNKIKETEPAYRYEHAVPARVVLYLMYQNIIKGDKRINLDLLKDDYRVTIIPIKEMDNILSDQGFTKSMLAGYIPGKQEWWKRYYNIFTKGRIPFALQSYEDSDNKIGVEFENYYNTINKSVVKADSQLTIDFDNNADIAMSNARDSNKYSQDVKKIRIFDFDDTLARTKSKVIVNMPYGLPMTKEMLAEAERLVGKPIPGKPYDNIVNNPSGDLSNLKGVSQIQFMASNLLDRYDLETAKQEVAKKYGKTFKITATEFARDSAKLEAEGATFDFTEFSKVIDGKKGPLFKVAKTIQDKRGSEDIFVLTARPQDAAKPIQEFLASMGLNIPLENITGLEDGSPKAKADWVINKYAEGYNDFYFTDDAFKNVKAVKDVFDVLDVKSKVQQARVKFSQDLNIEFNEMIERNKGIKKDARYSQVVAQRLGKNKKKYQFFIPPSADDFEGLTSYMFAGRGKQGEADQAWFEKALILPYVRGVAAIERAKQQVSSDYSTLQAGFPKIRKKLNKKIPGEQYTYDEAVRVYLWNKAEYVIPGISKRDQAKLDKIVREDPDLQSFADGVLLITKQPLYTPPQRHWQGTTITGDLNSLTTNINRQKYLKEFIDNVDVIFSEENLTKVEAIYGTRVRESLENIITRMKTGSNRVSGGKYDRQVNLWNDWVNRSVGAIMFINRRSGLLQLISTINFINWSDNNPIKAGEAFFNQPQFWKDVVFIFNSAKLKQRRSGLKGDINEQEIAAAVKGSTDKMSAFVAWLLKKGFIFTQIADSIAISTGGATFYRNRINTYKKQGYSTKDAEAMAWEDFSRISDKSQQSADPMMISQQQAGVLGRFILNFQNTPMQYTRLMKKAGLDIINNRGDLTTNISKILYYGMVQNFIFTALSNALFALIPGFDDPDDEELTEEEQIEKYGKVLVYKQEKIIHGMLDTILRGSGVAGAVIATIKNTYRRYVFEEGKGYNADHAYTLIEASNLSPVLGSKLRKIYAAIMTKKFEKDVIAERGYDVTINGRFQLSPSYDVAGQLASGLLNIPMDRLVAEINAVTEMLDSRNTIYQKLALGMGWRTWDVNAKIEEHDLIKAEGKERRKKEGIEKAKKTRAETNRKKKAAKKKEKEIEERRRASLSYEEREREDRLKDSLQNVKINKQIEEAFKKLDSLYGTDF